MMSFHGHSPTLMDEINRVSSKETAAIAYNSRMAYLTPPGYVGVSPTKEIEKKATGPGSTIKHKNYRKMPCPNEKLLPPVELMTRDQALRFAYLQEHDPKSGIKAMPGLAIKVDPEEEKKREEILKRIREKEIKDEIKKREERVKRLNKAKRMARFARSVSMSEPHDGEQGQNNHEDEFYDDYDDEDYSDSEYEDNDSLDKEVEKVSEEEKKKNARQKRIWEKKTTLAGEVYWLNRQTHKKSYTDPFAKQAAKPRDDLLEDGDYPESFDFLNNWKDVLEKDGQVRW
ncbi:hypothetical protein TrLO_g13941 [Triparma laevis f. longispina]|uniref:Uncharacterized protein n=1 Tax=Triparma laevis f. longispina TaxID=1714387 RepID=A0A9W7C820_9STRA|nr:hypothetical protein TrLO_g13941 [Triparma laevis f. longispina]